MEINNPVDLAPDSIYEILSRSPVETLGKCRLLSKQINTLTYDSNFMNLHSQRTKTISGFFVQSLRFSRYKSTFVSMGKNPNLPALPSLDFLSSDRVRIVASTSQGILLCMDFSKRVPSYYVCKPCTKQWRKIPNPKTKYDTITMAIGVLKSNPLHYKIVRFSKPKFCYFKGRIVYGSERMRCEVFDSFYWRWKTLDDVFLRFPWELLSYKSHVSACGSLHWITSKNNILAFHVEEETYDVFPFPTQLMIDYNEDGAYNWEYPTLVNYEGKLGISCIRGKGDNCSTELWVLENYLEGDWNKSKTLLIGDIRNSEPFSRPVAFYSSDVVLMNGYSRVFFYKFTNGNKEVVTVNDRYEDVGVFPFQSDYEDTNFGAEFEEKFSSFKSKKSPKKPKNSAMEAGEFPIIGQPRQNYSSFSHTMVFVLLLLTFTYITSLFDL